MKMHLNLATRDLNASVAFYRTLLLTEPAKHYADYALFVCDEPGLELALDLDPKTNVREGAHYGVVVDGPEVVDAAIARLRTAGYAIDIETAETCCYAVQNKVWATDPDGRRWETYHVLAETEERDEDGASCCITDGHSLPRAHVKPFVLFVCKHNTGRSQMAEAFLRRFAGDDIEVASAGTLAADRPEPGVVAAMAEVNVDISSARPKLIDPGALARADRIITMGCDVEGVPRVDDDWGLPDPKGQPPERVREIRDLVYEKAAVLARELLRPVP